MHQITKEMVAHLEGYQNAEKSEQMAAYMKHHFSFLGIPGSERKKLTASFLKESKNWSLAELEQIFAELYEQEMREFHYLAGDLLEKNIQRIPDAFEAIKPYFRYFQIHSWWDNVDQLRKPIGLWTKRNIEKEMPSVMGYFMESENMWDRRVAITLQLQWKELTQKDWLEKAIVQNEEDGEFFIQKGIGWALREYGKTNPEWVLEFVEAHKDVLTNLAVREGLKHLGK